MVTFLQEIDSTNRFLLEGNPPKPHGSAVYTQSQRAGRGTKGRTWQEQTGKGIAFSAVYHLPASCLPPLSLVIGLAARETIVQLYQLDTQLKWCNDLIIQNKKLAGILCESRLAGTEAIVVAGIGINLTHTQEDFSQLPGAISLGMLGVVVNPQILAEKLQENFLLYVNQLMGEGFPPRLQAQYTRHCLTLGKPVEILWNDQRPPSQGHALGVTETGALSCLIDGEEHQIHSGEVSIRGQKGYL